MPSRRPARRRTAPRQPPPFARLALATALVLLSYVVVHFASLVYVGPDARYGRALSDLHLASEAPALWVLVGTLAWVMWLLVAASLLYLGRALASTAPARAFWIRACGTGSFLAAVAALHRLFTSGQLGARFASIGASGEEALLESFRAAARTTDALLAAGFVAQAAGFLLAASAVRTWRAVPPWLPLWFALPGITALLLVLVPTLALVDERLEPWTFPIYVVHLLVGLAGAHFAAATTLWETAPPPGGPKRAAAGLG
jgi:hypothetical protein